ncbi:hypothetical protein [Catellatospora citrea]|nr:hypothetical protein [Catellatospora citrea]
MWFPWLSLPGPVRREAWRLAQADLSHPDPAVQDAAQASLLGMRRAVRAVGFAFFGIWVYRGMVDRLPEAVSLAGLVVSGLMMMTSARHEHMRQLAVAQWPALVARRPGMAQAVRLRLPVLWGLQSIAAVAAAPLVIIWVLVWIRRRGHELDQVVLVACASAAVLILLVGLAVAHRRRARPALEVDRAGVRLPVRGLVLPWDQVAEVAARAADRKSDGRVGLALRLRDPQAFWPTQTVTWWRRLLWGRPGPRAWVFVSDIGVREPVFPAYQAALACHAAHRAATESSTR